MQSLSRPLLVVGGVLAAATAASVLLSVLSLTVAVQARNQALPALAYEFPTSTTIHMKSCAEATQNDATFKQYDVEYPVSITNSGGRSVSLTHVSLLGGAQKDLPWPVALTLAPTNLGMAIDAGKATFVAPPAAFPPGQSRKVQVNGRLRINPGNSTQLETAQQLDAGGRLQLTLTFGDGTRKVMSVPYTVQRDEPNAGDTQACEHTGDFRYHVDQE